MKVNYIEVSLNKETGIKCVSMFDADDVCIAKYHTQEVGIDYKLKLEDKDDGMTYLVSK